MSFWQRWFGWLVPRKKSKVIPGVLGIPTPETLVQKVADVHAEQERQMLRLAEESIRRGHPEQAVIVYRKAAAKYHGEGRPLKEAAVLQRIVDLEPRDAQVLGRLVEIYEALDRRIDAAKTAGKLADLLNATGRVAEAQLYSAKADVLRAHHGRPSTQSSPSIIDQPAVQPGPVSTPPPEEDNGPMELPLDDAPAGAAIARLAIKKVPSDSHDLPNLQEETGDEMPGELAGALGEDSDAFSLGGFSQVSDPVDKAQASDSDVNHALSAPLPRRASMMPEPEDPRAALVEEPRIGGGDESIEDLDALADWESEEETGEAEVAEPKPIKDASTMYLPAVTKAALEADAQRSGAGETVHLKEHDDEATRAPPAAVTLALSPEDLRDDDDEEYDDDEGAATLFMSAIRREDHGLPPAEDEGASTLYMSAVKTAEHEHITDDEAFDDEYEGEAEEDDEEDGASTLFMPQIDEEMAARARADAARARAPTGPRGSLRIDDSATDAGDGES